MFEIPTSLEMLRHAKSYGLIKEVMMWARKHREENLNASLSECISHGYYEWIK